ncbi:MAG TPA: YIP1 family protein [Chloroflexaceae bacterium]|nr:YIP1 family protein [Chloroflexaceae bacterium]
MMELFNGALTLNQDRMRGLREAPDGVARGFLLVLFVGLLVGAVNGVSGLIQNATPERAVAALRAEVDRQVDQLVLTSNDTTTQELTRIVNENQEPFFSMLEELIALPTPLPRPVGLAFQLLASVVSTPLSYLAGMLLAAVVAHVAARQLGGQGSIQQMVALGSLSVAPHALDALAFIPGIGPTLGLVAWIGGLVVLMVAPSVAPRLDSLRAALAVLLYPLLLGLLAFLAFCVLVAALIALAGSA